MISICAPTFDTAAPIISTTGAAILQTASRRAKRVATLDGGAVLVDAGWSNADIIYKCSLPDLSGANHLALTRLMTNHPSAVLSTPRGCYSVLLSGLTYDKGLTVVMAEVLEVI